MPSFFFATSLLATALLAGVASAQTPVPPTAAVVPAPIRLSVFFATGSTSIRPQDIAVLDHASRVYTEGNPIVMILTATTDATGSPLKNLRLSQQRAAVVLNQLVARGIPAERFELLAKGGVELPVAAPAGMPELGNRRVDIAWR